MREQSQPQDQRRGELINQLGHETDPSERQRLMVEWLEAGGRELIDQATADGLQALKAG